MKNLYIFTNDDDVVTRTTRKEEEKKNSKNKTIWIINRYLEPVSITDTKA